MSEQDDNAWLGPDHTRDLIREARRFWPQWIEGQPRPLHRHGHECALRMAGELERLLVEVERLRGPRRVRIKDGPHASQTATTTLAVLPGRRKPILKIVIFHDESNDDDTHVYVFADEIDPDGTLVYRYDGIWSVAGLLKETKL
jgi:hypothetical protein